MVFTAPRVRRPTLDVTTPDVTPASARRARSALGTLAGRFSVVAASVGVGTLIGCSAPPGADLGPDGPPDFSSLPPGAAGASATPGNPAAPFANTPANPAPNGEQNPATSAPIAGSNNVGNGMGGAGATGGTPAGTAGSNMGVSGSTGMPPVAPTDPTPDEVSAFFAQLPCGAKYTAMGDGGYSACVRLNDGGAACTKTSAAFTRVTFSDGSPVTDVAQVSGMGENAIGVVTVDGALHVGNSATTINAAPIIASGVVNISGGRNARVALVTQGTGFGVMGWSNDATPDRLLTLPGGEQPIQVSANYGLACVLSTTGSVFCWQQGENVSIATVRGQTSPVPVDLGAPVRLVSAGQDTLCGVTFDDTLTCAGEFNASPYLPTQRVGGNIELVTTSFPSVREVHAAFRQGTIVRNDGAVFFLPGVGAGENNPGQQFTGATNVVASGGDRGTSCAVTAAGEVFCVFGATGGPTQRGTIDGAPLVAQTAPCPL